MITRIRHWLKQRAARKHSAWLRRNKVIMPRIPSWDRAAKVYGEQQ